jgi:hypothetical protein
MRGTAGYRLIHGELELGCGDLHAEHHSRSGGADERLENQLRRGSKARAANRPSS